MTTDCDYHRSVIDSDDEFLLNDNNTSTSSAHCSKCKLQNIGAAAHLATEPLDMDMSDKNWLDAALPAVNIVGDSFDSREDSPLLDHMLEFGHLTLNDYHCHSNRQEKDNSKALKKLIYASSICVLVMIAEIIGGYIAGSLAIMTDAAHLFSDFIGFIVSIISIYIGRKSATQSMTFGYYRAEVLGAFISVMAVWSLALVFCILAINRLIENDFDLDPDTMLVIASIGLVANIIMGAILHGSCMSIPHNHQHAHGHSHENINVRAAAAHVIGDILQSLGVLVAAVIIKFVPNTQRADPICTILFSILVVGATIRVARDSALVMLEYSPVPINRITSSLREFRGIKHVHSAQMWCLAPGKDAFAAHLAVDEFCDREQILMQATQMLRTQFNLVSCTLQIEAYNEVMMSNCHQCKLLQ